MHDGSGYPLPQSVHYIPGSGSSSLPTALFRTSVASDSRRDQETSEHVQVRGTLTLSHQLIDLARYGPGGSPDK